ncbi:MAG: acetoacetate decarboxylase [Leptospiraceae bacterium]|nr:acetoacetate decarboxylase [Leptospiraceae bacterium]
MANTQHYPPPWNLTGEGFIIPFLGVKSKLLEKGFINEEDKKDFRGGLGACMFVNYQTSNVGPYFELLFIPGDFEFKNPKFPKHRGKLYKKITKIYVSSAISIQEGRLNWAIPKEFANFQWIKENNKTKISVTSEDNHMFLETEFTSRFISFPVSTKLYPVSLLQRSDDKTKLMNTKFNGNGMSRYASIDKWISDEKFFAEINDISNFKLGLSMKEFNIVFPIPEIF